MCLFKKILFTLLQWSVFVPHSLVIYQAPVSKTFLVFHVMRSSDLLTFICHFKRP
jgi:hypothetical protein